MLTVVGQTTIISTQREKKVSHTNVQISAVDHSESDKPKDEMKNVS